MQSFYYSAFISYRHTLPDEAIAKKLHTYIENYAIPGSISRATGKKKMGRVFRDQEELPLSTDLGNDIRAALDNSEWLIAVCSPRYLESRWCMAELEYFISIGRKDHILVILAEGDPKDSFPPQLRYNLVDGKWVEVEPLAGDVRAASIGESLKKLKSEKARILAPMLGVSFDQLRQRARKRKKRIITAVAAAAFVLLAGFLSYALIKNGQVTRQRDIAVENEREMIVQRDLALDNQMKLLIEQANISSSASDKLTALVILRDAVEMRDTVGDGNDALLRTALEYALYCDPFDTVQTIANDNRQFDDMIFSHNDRYLLGVGQYYSATIIDAQTGEMLYTVARGQDSRFTGQGFTQDDRYFYTVDDYNGVIMVYEVATGNVYKTFENGEKGEYLISNEIYPLSDGRFLIPKEKSILIWDPETDAREEFLPASASPSDIYTRTRFVALSPDEKYLAFGSPGYGYGMRVVRLDDMSEVSLQTFDFPGMVYTPSDTSYDEPNKASGYFYINFSGDGKYLTATSGSFYFVWNAETGKMVLAGMPPEEYYGGGLSETILNHDGSILFYMLNNYLAAIDVESGDTLWEKTTSDKIYVTKATLSPNGKYLCSCGGIKGVFDVKTGDQLSGREVTAVSHNGKRLLADTFGNDPVLLASPDAATSKRTSGYHGDLYAADRYTAPSKSFRLDLTHKESDIYSTYPQNVGRETKIYTSPDVHYAVQTHYDGFLEVFDISDPDNCKEIYCIADHCFENVTDVTFNGDLMASCGGYDPRCVIFDLKKGAILHIVPGTDYVVSCEFSKDGSKIILLCGVSRDTALVYSTDTGHLLYRFEAPTGKSFSTVGFNEEGTEVAAVMSNGIAFVGILYPTLDDLIAAAAV